MTDAEMIPAVSFDKLPPPVNLDLSDPVIVYVVLDVTFTVVRGVFWNETDAIKDATDAGDCYVEAWDPSENQCLKSTFIKATVS